MILYRIQASTPVICANFMADIHTVPGLEIPECYQKIAVQKHTEVTDDWILYESSNKVTFSFCSKFLMAVILEWQYISSLMGLKNLSLDGFL